MPSHSVKQAKTMSAIAHGWEPSGKAANIPVKVAKDIHAADKGKKYGKGHDKGRDQTHSEFRAPHHSPAGIAGNDGFTGKLEGHFTGKGRGGSGALEQHKKQPHGKSIGSAPEHAHHRPNQSFEAEIKEHSHSKRGPVANIAAKGGSTMGHRGAFGNIDKPEGSHLLEQDNDRHAKQPHKGDGIGVSMHKSDGKGGAEHHKGSTMAHGSPFVFRAPPATGAHGYGHEGSQRQGHLRMSGHSGAHRIGHKR